MKTGRNEPCPCGSGKKYKKCCMLKNVTSPDELDYRTSERSPRQTVRARWSNMPSASSVEKHMNMALQEYLTWPEEGRKKNRMLNFLKGTCPFSGAWFVLQLGI